MGARLCYALAAIAGTAQARVPRLTGRDPMYLKFYGLDSKPFSIAPDPRFLYLSERHREALAHLLFGLGEGGGFVQLTGEVGTGKTTLSRAVLEQVPPHVDVARSSIPGSTSTS